ncbi:MAG: radical SAM protein [Nitrospirae bacterium]|nr:radical SAM protein [Nitrospirota bacterium]
MLKENVIKEIKAGDLPVVIAGAGIVGGVLLSVCKDAGIEVDCFCDSSMKIAGSEFCGKEVIPTPGLRERHKDAVILISVAAIKDVVDLLEGIGFYHWHAGGLLLRDIDFSCANPGSAIDYTKFAIENCILCHDGYLHPEKLFLRSIDIIITERCSLRCKDCSNLMQYYEKPRDSDLDMLLKSIDAFCLVVDEVMDFRIIGGDAFMNKEWPVIVERLTTEPKAKRVLLYTNGTIVPKLADIAHFKNTKVAVIITDYGVLSRKLHELRDILEEHKIAYHILKPAEWLDCAQIAPHKRGAEGNREIFRNCCAKNMATLSDGKLFRCPYGANANRLFAVPDCKIDYVDIYSRVLDGVNVGTIKDAVKNYLLNKEYLEVCDYCNGRPLSGKEVTPAVQVDRPLAYPRYVVA